MEDGYKVSREIIREVISELGIHSRIDFSDLEKLSVLRDKGIINEKEFTAKKKLILEI